MLKRCYSSFFFFFVNNYISFSLNQDFIWSNWNIIIERVLRLNEVLFKIDRPIFLWNLEYRKRYKKNILYISRYIVFQSLFLIALTYDRVNELVHSHPWLQTFDQAWITESLSSFFQFQLTTSRYNDNKFRNHDRDPMIGNTHHWST